MRIPTSAPAPPHRLRGPASGRAASWVTRALSVIAAPALALAGCDADREARCADTYAHLTEIAAHHTAGAHRDAFLAACVDLWDEGWIACLERASDPAEATACRPTRKRPG